MVRDNINRSWRPFYVVSPTLEHFEDGKKLFVVNIVIQLHRGESRGVKSDWMNLIVGRSDSRQNGVDNLIKDLQSVKVQLCPNICSLVSIAKQLRQ